MRRRDLLRLGGMAAAWLPAAGARPALAQAPGRVYRLGHLANSVLSESSTRDTALPELARHGFVEGGNLVFDGRVGDAAALPELMRELLDARPDAVIAVGQAAISVAGTATRTVPIVGFGGDPVGLGLAGSYRRPGGNVTGVTILTGELEAKRLSILHAMAPDRRRVAALLSATQREHEPELRKAAIDLGLELLVYIVAAPAEYSGAFADMQAAGARALVVGAAPELFRDAKQIAALALGARLPTACEWAEMAHAGCLIGYGPNRPVLRQRMAAQIAQIFRGAAPGDVAIELPTVFDLAVNQRIAKSLDLTIPLGMLAQAGEVIE